MPLLKKKTFVKASVPEYLRDDEEVFYCAITNEIFRDYEEFSERMFLCNSMVWTCSMTGKTNLTYVEALESEENAKKSLREFPSELKIPILYLATKTKRTAFGEMAEDVFIYAKDRYFIGENVETSFTGNKWKDSHVLQVIAPTADQIKNAPKNGSVGDRHFHPSASLYKYEIEHLDAYDKDISEIMIVDYSQIRRKKGLFSRERCKLFLKQYVEQEDRGFFVIKKSALQNFGMSKVTFEQIFDGPLPPFETSRKRDKATHNGVAKKTKQESLHKFLMKNMDGKTAVQSGENKSNLLEQMRKREEEFKLIKQQRKEEEMALKQKKKEENVMLAGHLKEWNKPKEDLELEDHQMLPDLVPVKSKVPDKYYGDMLMILEFVNSFSKLLSTKDFFPGGLTVDIMERALMENEVAGPLTDLIQMLLSALFNVQDEEASQYTTEIEATSTIKQEDVPKDLSLHEATRLATSASTWSIKHQGLPLARLPLYPLTTSEILRLHLLSSGARINDSGARWRYQQRGGYTSEDDPGLYLRLHQPHILKSLAVHNVAELSTSDKIKIVSCLIDQLLTYADVRDVIEERMDKIKQAKVDLKMLQVAERKREEEFRTSRAKLKKEGKDNPKLADDLRKLEDEADRKKHDNEWNVVQLTKTSYATQVLMGEDRAFRRYLSLESVPGVFVNFEEDNPGTCLSSIVKQDPELVNADRNTVLNHIKKTLEEVNSSDKENSPSKSLMKVNGVRNPLTPEQEEMPTCDGLLMCSSDPSDCMVHSIKVKRTKWSFVHKTDTLDELVNTLNKRGLRESELRQNLKSNRGKLVELIEDTPVTSLNVEIDLEEPEENRQQGKKNGKANKYEDANLGYPADTSIEDILHNTLVENILEMEEKIHLGNLGCLLIKDREKWREALQNKNYKGLERTINKRPVHKRSNSRQNTPDPELSKPYHDPGLLLGATLDVSLDDSVIDDNCDILLSQTKETAETVTCLATAVAQVARAVERRYLKKPLGHADGGRNDKKKDDVLDMWEHSLLSATSFSQIFLHYCTLDSCVMWTRSALLAKCRICRRQTDSENMLLCDECNLGHHLYCLKPPLKSVPTGDWFCTKCTKERQKREAIETPKPPSKRRPIFRDEEVEEEEEESEEQDESSEEDTEEEEEDHHPLITIKVELCKTCGSGGEVITCDQCSETYHIECVDPPLRRAPRGPWSCSYCKRKRTTEKRYYKNGAVVQRTGVVNGQRRCAAKALYKIHDFARSLRHQSESEDSEEEEVVQKRATRRDEVRDDLPLHNAALHELLSEVMRDANAWPFLRPVQKIEVPDYYDVITKPMDFGTIKYKLNMGEYQEDSQFMSDAVLIFQNCNTYNHTDDDVFKCGVELVEVFRKKCRDLGLKLPDEMDYDDEMIQPKKKHRRTK